MTDPSPAARGGPQSDGARPEAGFYARDPAAVTIDDAIACNKTGEEKTLVISEAIPSGAAGTTGIFPLGLCE